MLLSFGAQTSLAEIYSEKVIEKENDSLQLSSGTVCSQLFSEVGFNSPITGKQLEMQCPGPGAIA